MKRRLVRSLSSIFQLLLRLYPQHFREEFGSEMTAVFARNVEDASKEGGWEVAVVGLRELHATPHALVTVYRHEWMRKWRTGLRLLHGTTFAGDLPPPPPDGRDSWRQAALELSLFLIAGLVLLGITYLSPEAARAGWQRDLGLLVPIITTLALPVFLIGLARGLPRWAYPYGGLLLVTHSLRAHQSGLWPFLIIMFSAYALLAAAALLTDPQPSPLPGALRRIGQSLSLDWTRLSFGVYGAAPLPIIMAFDDGHVNDLTPYLALSVLAMVAGVLIYCRSRQKEAQIGALIAGMTISIWAAWLDKVALAGGSAAWIAAPSPGRAEMDWILTLWFAWMALILIPALLGNAGHLVMKRSL